MEISKNKGYKAIFSDIDGTLLNKDRELSDATIKEIKRISKKNIQFILVSARMPSGIMHLHNQLSISSPIICYNGALVIIPTNNNSYSAIDSKPMDFDAAEWLIQKTKELNVHCSIYSNDWWVTEKRDYWTLREENNTKVVATISDLDNTFSSWKNNYQHIHKIMVMGDSALIDQIEQESNKRYSNAVNAYRSKDTYLEVTPKSVSKASACSFVLQRLGISSDEAIAFGDNYNDIDMLSMVKLGVAMDNAVDEVKKAANLVAPSNKADGVAKVLKDIFI